MNKPEESPASDLDQRRLAAQGKLGNIAAIFQLQALDVRTGVVRKGVESIWLKKIKTLASEGSLEAAYVLWTELTTGTQFGILNLIEARQYLEMAASGGHAGAISDLQEENDLFEFWARSAEAGSGLFAYNLYEAYTSGKFGEIDTALAKKYLLRSAQLGYKLALRQLSKNDKVMQRSKK